jgi:predicted permease
VTPGYFRTLGIPHRSGRDFEDADTADTAPVAIVSEELVRQQFPDGNPLGRRLRISVEHASGRNDVEWTIVGVVGSTRSTLDGPFRQTIFIPRAQRPGGGITLFVRTARDPMTLATGVAGVMRALEPDAPVNVRTLDQVVGSTIARPRAISVLVAAFALVALALAAVGVYGVMAYSVRGRTKEIGVRLALGATAGSVLRLVLGRAMRLVALGIAIGLVAAALLTRALERLLFDVEPLDPWTFGATALVLLAVAAIASYLPARRGMKVSPITALRMD